MRARLKWRRRGPAGEARGRAPGARSNGASGSEQPREHFHSSGRARVGQVKLFELIVCAPKWNLAARRAARMGPAPIVPSSWRPHCANEPVHLAARIELSELAIGEGTAQKLSLARSAKLGSLVVDWRHLKVRLLTSKHLNGPGTRARGGTMGAGASAQQVAGQSEWPIRWLTGRPGSLGARHLHHHHQRAHLFRPTGPRRQARAHSACETNGRLLTRMALDS